MDATPAHPPVQPPEDPARPQPRLPRRGIAPVLLAAGAYYVLLSAVPLGGALGVAVPCTGKFCELGNGLLGMGVGAVVASVAAAVVGHLLGLRWWFVPVTLVVAAGGAPALGSALGVDQGSEGPGWVPAAALGVLGMFAPIGGGILAGHLTRLTRTIALVTLAGLVVLGTLTLAWQGSVRRAESERRIEERFRTVGIPVHAPAARPDVRTRLVSTTPAESLIYDLSVPDQRGWLRVRLIADGERSRCADAAAKQDLGGGVLAVGWGTRYETLCRDLGAVTADVWSDGSDTTWSGGPAEEVVRALGPVSAEWLIEHAR